MFSIFSKRTPIPQSVRIPDDTRVYAIGDVHGRADLFDHLLEMVAADHAARDPMRCVIVLLGDLVDRGPDSAGVVDRAIRLVQEADEVRLLTGNHEEIFAMACAGDRDALRLFTRIGGRETAESYGIDGEAFDLADFADLHDMLERAVPAEHLAFLEQMEDQIIIGDYAFVHAGIRPGIKLTDQNITDLRWIRDRFLNHTDPHEKFIVHGHTITDEIDERPNRLGIDTGAYATGRLTAVALEADRRWFLQTGAPN